MIFSLGLGLELGGLKTTYSYRVHLTDMMIPRVDSYQRCSIKEGQKNGILFSIQFNRNVTHIIHTLDAYT